MQPFWIAVLGTTLVIATTATGQSDDPQGGGFAIEAPQEATSDPALGRTAVGLLALGVAAAGAAAVSWRSTHRKKARRAPERRAPDASISPVDLARRELGLSRQEASDYVAKFGAGTPGRAAAVESIDDRKAQRDADLRVVRQTAASLVNQETKVAARTLLDGAGPRPRPDQVVALLEEIRRLRHEDVATTNRKAAENEAADAAREQAARAAKAAGVRDDLLERMAGLRTRAENVAETRLALPLDAAAHLAGTPIPAQPDNVADAEAAIDGFNELLSALEGLASDTELKLHEAEGLRRALPPMSDDEVGLYADRTPRPAEVDHAIRVLRTAHARFKENAVEAAQSRLTKTLAAAPPHWVAAQAFREAHSHILAAPQSEAERLEQEADFEAAAEEFHAEIAQARELLETLEEAAARPPPALPPAWRQFEAAMIEARRTGSSEDLRSAADAHHLCDDWIVAREATINEAIKFAVTQLGIPGGEARALVNQAPSPSQALSGFEREAANATKLFKQVSAAAAGIFDTDRAKQAHEALQAAAPPARLDAVKKASWSITDLVKADRDGLPAAVERAVISAFPDIPLNVLGDINIRKRAAAATNSAEARHLVDRLVLEARPLAEKVAPLAREVRSQAARLSTVMSTLRDVYDVAGLSAELPAQRLVQHFEETGQTDEVELKRLVGHAQRILTHIQEGSLDASSQLHHDIELRRASVPT